MLRLTPDRLILITLLGATITVVSALTTSTLLSVPTQDRWELIPFISLEDEYPDGIPNAPRSRSYSELGLISLADAQQRVEQFSPKIPDQAALPPGFSVRGATYRQGRTEVFRGEAFTPESVTLLIWDRPILPDMTTEEFDRAGGIIIDFTYSPCVNSLEGYQRAYKTANVEFMWGHPTAYSDRFVETCHLDENIGYGVYGRYHSEPLLELMESLIRA